MHGIQGAPIGGKTVVLLGCGPIGLMAAGIAKAHGANQVISSDIVDAKLEIAKIMGATITVNSAREDLEEVVRKATDGRGADVVIDYSGAGVAIAGGLKCLKIGGTMVLVGLPDKPVQLDLVDGIIYREATLVGVTGRRMYDTWYECEKLLRSGKIDLAPVVGGKYDLRDYEAAFKAIENKVPGKMLLIP
jgi:threonine 3-dehydrogenase